MSEQKTPTDIYEERKRDFTAYLTGDLQTNALDFAEYLLNSGADNYKGVQICWTFIPWNDGLCIFFNGMEKFICDNAYINFPIDESMKEFAWANANVCGKCNTENGCGRGGDRYIFGKKFDDLCYIALSINNPDADTFEKTKKFIDACKICIDTTNNENTRFAIEDAFEKNLSGDRLKNAQKLFAFLKTNDVVPETIDNDCWNYKGNGLFVIHAYGDDDNNWFMYGNLETWEKYPITDGMKEFIWASIRVCTGQCGCPNWPRGGNRMVFGKEFKSVCSSVFFFQNPEGETLENIKKLVLLAKKNIDNL